MTTWLDIWKQKNREAITLKAKSEAAKLDADYALIMHQAGESYPLTPEKPSTPASTKICCEKCKAELTPYTRQNGSVMSVDDLVKSSKKYNAGQVLCFDCQPKRERRGRRQ